MLHSVILTNFNGCKYLEEAIQSVLAQEAAEYELLLVDDGSDDASVEIMRTYEREHPEEITISVHGTNRGQGAGFNTGFSRVTGDLVSFIDSDDVWYPRKLSTIEKLFSENPEAVMLHHNLQFLKDSQIQPRLVVDMMVCGDCARNWRKWLKTRSHINYLARFAPTSGLTFPRRVLSKIMPCPEVRFCADMYPTFAVAAMGPIVASYQAFGAYRVHSDNRYFGRKNFDVWDFFYDEIAPALRQFYARSKLRDLIPPAGSPDAVSDLVSVGNGQKSKSTMRNVIGGMSLRTAISRVRRIFR